MTKIILSGAQGRMGKVITQLATENSAYEIVAGIDRQVDTSATFPIYHTLADVKESADVVIDFSYFENVPTLLDDAQASALPIVVATTGLPEETLKKMESVSQTIPVFFSANMSLGINVLIQALQQITPSLEADFDIEMIEKHHNQKKDAPSGTALLLADSINDVCQTKKEYVFGRQGNHNENLRSQMGIHAVRGGTIPGEHTVLFAGQDELIELKHTALSRDIFANGALKAAAFLVSQKPGLYSMNDLLAHLFKRRGDSMSDLQFTDPYELAKFIKNAAKQTPVKAYISGDLADVKATDIHLFGSNSFYFAVGDAEPLRSFGQNHSVPSPHAERLLEPDQPVTGLTQQSLQEFPPPDYLTICENIG